MNFAKGYKTYAIAVIGVTLGAYAGLQPIFHLPAIPTFVYIVLGFSGLYTARNGISTDTQKAVTDVLAQITIPATVNVTANTANIQAPAPEDPFLHAQPKKAG